MFSDQGFPSSAGNLMPCTSIPTLLRNPRRCKVRSRQRWCIQISMPCQNARCVVTVAGHFKCAMCPVQWTFPSSVRFLALGTSTFPVSKFERFPHSFRQTLSFCFSFHSQYFQFKLFLVSGFCVIPSLYAHTHNTAVIRTSDNKQGDRAGPVFSFSSLSHCHCH